MKTQYLRFILYTIIASFAGLNLAAGSVPPPGANDAHFFGYTGQQPDNRVYARSLANLDAGDPYTVRMIYFHPSDRAPVQDIDTKLDAMIKNVQVFYANEMERHGFGRKTFTVETNADGNALVHHIRGRLTSSDYSDNKSVLDLNEKFHSEINDQLNSSKNIHVIAVDFDFALGGGGFFRGGSSGGRVFIALDRNRFDTSTYLSIRELGYLAAHELGHAFGLNHDFRNPDYIMAYRSDRPPQLSRCAAEWLNAHRYFNTSQTSVNNPPAIQMLPPLPSPPNAIRFRFEVTDGDGLHQAHFLIPTTVTDPSKGSKLQGCNSLSGESDTMEFVTTELSSTSSAIGLKVIDVDGNWVNQRFPINITMLLPAETVVSISNAQLAAPVRHALGLGPDEAITQLKMLELTRLKVDSGNIVDLTGLEHANHLFWLRLQYNQIDDITPLAGLTRLANLELGSNNISNISAVAGLTGLTRLILWSNAISDIWAVSGLSSLTSLSLSDNPISDISAIDGLTDLIWLHFDRIHVSDISAVAGLTNLEELHFSDNLVSDISAVAGLTNLTELRFSGNLVSDISAVAGLTNLTVLSLQYNNILDIAPLVENTGLGSGDSVNLSGNPLSHASIYTHIPALQERGVEVFFDHRTPQRIRIVSGNDQGGLPGTALDMPFVVEVRDERGVAFEGLPVTFTVTAGDGTLSTTKAATDANGRAESTLTLGSNQGTLTVSVVAAKISQPVRFNATVLVLSSPVTLPDAGLRAKITEALGTPRGAPLTMGDMLRLTTLTANSANIRELTGLHLAANLTTLSLGHNNISDAAPLAALSHLKRLDLIGNPLSYPSLRTHIPAMRARGVVVTVDPRTPTRLLHISSAHGVAGGEIPLVVEVQDQHHLSYSGVPVTFTVTEGGGRVSAATVLTDIAGIAQTTLTLGSNPGENTVRVSAAELPQSVRVTITAIDTSTPVAVPDAALRAKIAEALGTSAGAPFSAGQMLKLTHLEARNANITDLTGIEHATNLKTLDLSSEYIEADNRLVNSNSVSDLFPLAGLTKLTYLDIRHNDISNISAVSGLTNLNTLFLGANSISDISAVEGLTNLTSLDLRDNSISDISAVTGLTNLTWLNLGGNSISDSSAIAGLTNLTWMALYGNNISDISPLVENAGLDSGDRVIMTGNPLSYPSIYTHIPTLQERGVEVRFENRVPQRIRIVSGNDQGGLPGTALDMPFVVEVRDERGVAFEGLPVTFTVTAGDGTLSVVNTTTDENGRAQSRLTLGTRKGTNIVEVSASGTDQTVTFSGGQVVAAHIPDLNLRAAIAAALGKPQSGFIGQRSMGELTVLEARNANISNLTGLEGATNLKTLDLSSEYIEAENRQVNSNSVSDLSPLAGLTRLTFLNIHENDITDISPLVKNSGIGRGDRIDMNGNPLSYPSIYTHIPTLQERGVEVFFGNRTPHRIRIVSGNDQGGLPGTALDKPFVVEVRDERGVAFEGVPVTFTVTAGGGTLNVTSATTSDNGRAESILTLGSNPGTNTVEVAVAGIQETQTVTAIAAEDVHIPDPNLAAAIQDQIGGSITTHTIADVTSLNARNANISNLTGLEHATNLKTLSLRGNSVSDISSLTGLTNLTVLGLANNDISDISVVTRLNNLASLWLGGNRITNLSPLVENTGLGTGDRISLERNPLSYPSIYTHIPALRERGLEVSFDNRTPQRIRIVSGNDQGGLPGTALDMPFVVEVQDQRGVAFEGVPVTFTVTAGDGKLSVSSTTANKNGMAQSRLTLGPNPGTNTVTVSVTGIQETQTVSAFAKSPRIPEDVNRDDVVNILDLVSVASFLGEAGQDLMADVNGDGIVNILDLVLVAGALGNAAAAPSAWYRDLERDFHGNSIAFAIHSLDPSRSTRLITPTRADVVRWLAQAGEVDLTDPASRRGVLFLEQLLAALTPKATALLPNYPNPFNPETWIPYQLVQDAYVALTIYDRNGAVVRRLDLGHQSAGFYESRSEAIYWDGCNKFGEGVASGVYLYRLSAGDFSAARKMLVVK